MEANPNNLHTELCTIVWFANCTSPQLPLWRSRQKRERVEVKKDWCQKVGEWQILTFFTEMYEIMLEINQKARGRTIITLTIKRKGRNLLCEKHKIQPFFHNLYSMIRIYINFKESNFQKLARYNLKNILLPCSCMV